MPDVTVTPSTTSVSVAGAIQLASLTNPWDSAVMFSDMVGNSFPFNDVVGVGGNGRGSITYSGQVASWGHAVLVVGNVGNLARASIQAAPTSSPGQINRIEQWGVGNWDILCRCVKVNCVSEQRTFFGYGITHGPIDDSAGQRFMLSDGAGFVAYGSGGYWELQINYTVTDEEGNRTVYEDTVVSTARTDEWHNLRITLTDGPTAIRWYIDEVLVREMTSAFPPIDASVTPGIEFRDKSVAGTASIGNLLVDYMRVTRTFDRL